MCYGVFCLNVFPSEPGLLIKPADGSHDRQEEQTEHEIGFRAQPLVQKMADVEEQERCEDNGESPGAQHQAERVPDPIILAQKILNRRILSPDDKCSDQKNNRL